jgi:hypothetical protein
MKYILTVFTVFLMACGGEKVQPPEEYFIETEKYSKWLHDEIGGKLAWRSLSEFNKGDNKMAVWAGYFKGKPLMARLVSPGEYGTKWWIYGDTATGKVVFFKEETEQGGKMVQNRFSYRGDSISMAMSGNVSYKSQYGENDFRMKYAEVEALMKEVIASVEKDIPILSTEANAARRDNAQFYATGGKNSWSLVINPSLSSVTLKEPGSEDRTFGYDVPVTGPKNESIYNFNSLKGKIEVSIFGKACGVGDGKSYPYTVVVVDGSKSFAGCGVLLQ